MTKHSLNEIAQNKPYSLIREPITFTHLTVLNEDRSNTGIEKT
jgi:hypothetical protein